MLITETMTRAAVFLMIEEVVHLTEDWSCQMATSSQESWGAGQSRMNLVIDGQEMIILQAGNLNTDKERPAQSLKTSRDTSPSSASAASSSKVLDKPSRLTEKELAEAASKWAAEKLEKADESNLPEISEYEAGSTAPLFTDQPEEPESNTADAIELFEDSQLTSRSKAIASKTKEIEQVYRQDCETFGMVVKMLIEKDPSLEKSIQFALRQNLHEIESAGQTQQLAPHVMNAATDHVGTLKNEGEETAQSHNASNITTVQPEPNPVPEVKEVTPKNLQSQRLRLRRTAQAPSITWGVLKKTTQEAEQILLRTQTPCTPDNLFLAMLSVIHCNSCKDAKPKNEQ
uniref:Periphilin 1 n=1 Tax=Callithrix jacchus TaxID=9483 RepID=A0A8I3WKX6_CALJA